MTQMQSNLEEALFKTARESGLVGASLAFNIRFKIKAGNSLLAQLRENDTSEPKIEELLATENIRPERNVKLDTELIARHAKPADAAHHRTFPYRLESDTLIVISDDPAFSRNREFAARMHPKTELRYAAPALINKALSSRDNLPGELQAALKLGLASTETLTQLYREHPQNTTSYMIQAMNIDEEATLRQLCDELNVPFLETFEPSAMLPQEEVRNVRVIAGTIAGEAAHFTPDLERYATLSATYAQLAVTTLVAFERALASAYPGPVRRTARPRRIQDMLHQMGKLTDAQLDLGEDEIKRLVAEVDFYQAIATMSDKPFIDPDLHAPDENVKQSLPPAAIKQFQIYPYRETDRGLQVLISDPRNSMTMRSVQQAAKGVQVMAVVATPSAITKLINRTIDRDKVVVQLQEEASNKKPAFARIQVAAVESDTAVVKTVDQILKEAIDNKVNDIHIEPKEHGMVVKYRIDGRLTKVLDLPAGIARQLVARIKVLSNMDPAINMRPLDGRLVYSELDVEFRVSTIPVAHGEKTVLRMLGKGSVPSIKQLGFSAANTELINKIIDAPNGIFLVTGPTGSGKTTTCNSLLTQIAVPSKNTVSIEDPIEYEIPTINQSQVTRNMSFADALRAFLRQDPDNIFIGEIRDQETAKIGMEAALTGHFVMATLHTNDAPGAVTRLVEMGIEPFSVTGSLIGVMGQRLVRRLCPHCRKRAPVSAEVAAKLELDPSEEVWTPVGCDRCTGGYRGRLGIHEVMLVSEDLRTAIANHQPHQVLREIARKAGMHTLREDGVTKARDGVTSVYEVASETKQ